MTRGCHTFWAERPLFIPLRAEFFDAFKSGAKDTEYRLRGLKWNAETCRIGRKVTLSRGYSRRDRLKGEIIGFCYDTCPAKLPGWLECYGQKAGDACCIKIALSTSVSSVSSVVASSVPSVPSVLSPHPFP